MDKYISIKEFAARANVSTQSIYKKLSQVDNKLQAYCKQVDKQKMLNIKALQEVYGVEVEQLSTGDMQLLDMLKEQLESKDRQLDAMAAQLENKDKQLDAVIQQLSDAMTALKASQALQANTEKKLIEISEEQDSSGTNKRWWQIWKRI